MIASTIHTPHVDWFALSPALVLLGAAGICLLAAVLVPPAARKLVSANNLMTLFLGLEWFSISLYILCAVNVERPTSLEAGLKYLIIGGVGSAFLLFGSALVYGATGKLGFADIAHAVAAQGLSGDALLIVGLAMILVGFGYKSSAAPFHMWTPDVYEGAPTPVTAFMSAATKAVALVLTLRVLVTAFPQEAHVLLAAP